MPIGLHVRKYQEQKEARAAAASEEPSVESPTDDAPMTQRDFLAAMAALIEGIKASNMPTESKDRLALEAERLTLERERLKREMPENKQAPGISVYSHPEGDLKHPKDPLKCKIFWIGYELNTDTLTPHEIDLLNRLQPGEFRVTKTDMTAIPFQVSAKLGDRIDPASGRQELRELSVWFPCKAADQKQNHGTMVQYLQQALGERVPTAAELQAELQKLRAELAAVGA